MKQRHVLAPVMAAVLAALGAGAAQAQYDATWQRDVAAKDTTALSREQVQQELAAARSAGWQGYGSEVTIAPPEEAAPRTGSRDQVVAELNEWRTANAIETWAPEGSEAQVQEQRMALHKQQVQRYAAAQQAEQQRLAREREAEAQRLAAQTAVPQADGGVVGGSGTAEVTSAAPADNSGAPPADLAGAPAQEQPQPQSPPVGSTDAAIDSTRSRSSPGMTDSLSATPQPVPEPAPSDARPLDAATPAMAPPDAGVAPAGAPSDAANAPADTSAGSASPSAVPSPVTDAPPAASSSDLPPAAADAPAAPR